VFQSTHAEASDRILVVNNSLQSFYGWVVVIQTLACPISFQPAILCQTISAAVGVPAHLEMHYSVESGPGDQHLFVLVGHPSGCM
jgi:hypothetical protein